ncbi:MAG: hypothetical protein JNK85_01405 [Verrucomicrobiales bacterium]|nr:hypothetical protein [Verrucomicrobiales bacterium]
MTTTLLIHSLAHRFGGRRVPRTVWVQVRVWLGVLIGLLGVGRHPVAVAQLPLESWLAAATTTRADRDGQAWIVVAWSAARPDVLKGRVLALYTQPGGMADPGSWMRAGLVNVGELTRTTVAQAVARGTALGDDPVALASAIDRLSGRPESAQATTPVDKLVWLVEAAESEAVLATSLELLVPRFHSVRFAAGRGWAVRLPAGPTGIEVRELDPASGEDRFVVARFNVDCGSPTPLKAPAAPQVTQPKSTADHLHVGLVWGAPEALLRRRPLLAGFDLWRVPAAVARQAGWGVRAPGLVELQSQGTRLNDQPIVPSRILSPAEAVAAAQDPSQAMWLDAGPGRAPWRDGDEFAWFVVAIDLAGNQGEPSMAGFGFVCDRMPARIPRHLSAANDFQSVETHPRQHVIQLRWDSDDAEDHRPARFEVFRGASELPAIASTNEPPAAWKLADVPVPAQGQKAVWTDATMDPSLDPTLYGRGFWYAVRSVRETQCGPVSSALCPPVFVNIRRFDAPDAPVGELGIQCPRVVVLPPNPNFGIEPLNSPDRSTRHYRVSFRRRDAGVAWVEVTIDSGLEGALPLDSPQLRYGEQQDEVVFDFGLPRLAGVNPVPRVRAVAGSYSGATSEPLVYELPNATGPGELWIARSEVATVVPAEARPDDPIFGRLMTGPFPLAGVSRGADLVFWADSPTSTGEVVVQAARPGTPSEGDWRWVANVHPSSANAAVGPRLRFVDPEVPAGTDGLHEVVYRAWIVTPSRSGIVFPCGHVARPAGSQVVYPINVGMALPARTKQWRMYRQLDDAPLTLFAEGVGDFPNAGAGAWAEAKDDAIPVGAARLCYFGQAADENGNWSPLGPLGCEDSLAAKMPVPLLAAPEAEGDLVNPVMRLRWFCAPDGLSRFRVILKPVAGPAPSQGGSPWTSKFPALAVSHPRPVQWFSMMAETKALAGLVVASSFETGFIGEDATGSVLGPGPDFTTILDVAAETVYEVQVAAVDARGNLGAASGIQRFSWRLPRPTADREVPWPQRPLPPVQSTHLLMAAVLLHTNLVIWPANSNSAPVGVRIGRIDLGQRELVGDLLGLIPGERGGLQLRTFATRSAVEAGKDLESFLFPDTQSLPPREMFRPINVVMYRQQVTNAEFPRVSGDVVQVTPLVRRMAAAALADGSGFEFLDPALGLTLHLAPRDPEVNLSRPPGVDLHLLDQHPVARGARYRYWLVHFDGKGEPDRTLPAGEVEVPL